MERSPGTGARKEPVNLDLLTIIVQASLIGWAVLIGAVAVGAARRALQARRRRRTYWTDLVRHYRTSSALIARWSDND